MPSIRDRCAEASEKAMPLSRNLQRGAYICKWDNHKGRWYYQEAKGSKYLGDVTYEKLNKFFQSLVYKHASELGCLSAEPLDGFDAKPIQVTIRMEIKRELEEKNAQIRTLEAQVKELERQLNNMHRMS